MGNDLSWCKDRALSQVTKTFQFRHTQFSSMMCEFPHRSILCLFIYLRFWLIGRRRGSRTVTSSERRVWCLATTLFALVSGWIKQTSYALTLPAFHSMRALICRSFLLSSCFVQNLPVVGTLIIHTFTPLMDLFESWKWIQLKSAGREGKIGRNVHIQIKWWH